MSGHLRYAGRGQRAQRAALAEILRADPLIWDALTRALRLGLPDWRIVSGAIYNTVWNALSGRPSGYGIKDIDLFYFDDSDLSYAAEDRVIARAASHFQHRSPGGGPPALLTRMSRPPRSEVALSKSALRSESRLTSAA